MLGEQATTVLAMSPCRKMFQAGCRLVFAFIDFLALAGEAEVKNWEERERTTLVEVQEADLQTSKRFGARS